MYLQFLFIWVISRTTTSVPNWPEHWASGSRTLNPERKDQRHNAILSQAKLWGLTEFDLIQKGQP
jgi:hypothetical protein